MANVNKLAFAFAESVRRGELRPDAIIIKAVIKLKKYVFRLIMFNCKWRFPFTREWLFQTVLPAFYQLAERGKDLSVFAEYPYSTRTCCSRF